MLGRFDEHPPGLIGNTIGARAGVVGVANGSVHMLDRKSPGRVGSRRDRHGTWGGIAGLILEGVAIFLPPGVKVLKVDLLLSKGVPP
eukprot:8381787-Heterocapsa_arctica.AAC.1